MTERSHLNLEKANKLSDYDKIHFVTNIALHKNKRLIDLTKDDLESTRSGSLFMDKLDANLNTFLAHTEKEYQNRILKALDPPKNETFLHTAPHHDDIMLGYLPFLFRLMRDQSNSHFFNYLTSGFTAVTNSFMLEQTNNAARFLQIPEVTKML